MYIVPIAWLYVVLMMAVAEATNTTGTLLGAIITFVLYGLGPVALVVYLMGAPARKRAIKAREKIAKAGILRHGHGKSPVGSHAAARGRLGKSSRRRAASSLPRLRARHGRK